MNMLLSAPRTERALRLRERYAARASVLLPFTTLIGLIIIFGIAGTNFLTLGNALNVLRECSVLLIVALAGTFVILMGSIDLSVGSIVNLSGVATALVVPQLGARAMLVGLAVGLAAGLVNGLLYTVLRIPSFLVTLGALSAFGGIANIISGGQPIAADSPGFMSLSNGILFLSIPNLWLWAFALWLVCLFVAYRMRFGRYMYALGGGEKVAQWSGVRVNRYKVYAFMLSGVLCGLAGVLLTSEISSFTPGMGDPFLLDSIAAVVIGGTALSGGVGGPHRTLLGVLVIAILTNGMDIVGIQPFTQMVIKGLVVIVAVALTIDRKKFALIK